MNIVEAQWLFAFTDKVYVENHTHIQQRPILKRFLNNGFGSTQVKMLVGFQTCQTVTFALSLRSRII
jgi:hypothetical protein